MPTPRQCYFCGKVIYGQSHTCNTSEYTKRHSYKERTPIMHRELLIDRLKLGFAMMKDGYED